jgi:hypothetical protein
MLSASANVAASAHRIESCSVICFFEIADLLQVIVVVVVVIIIII